MIKHLAHRKSELLKLGVPEEKIVVLNDYLNHLMSANEDLNLVSRKMTLEELVDNHLIDCLLPLAHFPKDLVTVSDLGTGGGLPGVVYAILFPQVKFQLFEKSPKKKDFLNSCKTFAPNISVFGEINSANLKNTQLIMARGFKPLDVILDLTRDYYKNGGKYFLLKARLEKVNEDIAASQKFLKIRPAEVIRLHSPVLEVERHLVRV